jgi:hypothetical protein
LASVVSAEAGITEKGHMPCPLEIMAGIPARYAVTHDLVYSRMGHSSEFYRNKHPGNREQVSRERGFAPWMRERRRENGTTAQGEAAFGGRCDQ